MKATQVSGGDHGVEDNNISSNFSSSKNFSNSNNIKNDSNDDNSSSSYNNNNLDYYVGADAGATVAATASANSTAAMLPPSYCCHCYCDC